MKLKKLVYFFNALIMTVSFVNMIPQNIHVAALSQEEEVVKLVNDERAKHGLRALKISPTLMNNAALRADEVSRRFDHSRPNGRNCFTAIDSYIRSIDYREGENIAYGASDAAGAVNIWMNSAPHRANILDSRYTHIGVGRYQIDKNVYWVQIFVGTNYSLSGEYIPQESYTPSYQPATEPPKPIEVPQNVRNIIAYGIGNVNGDSATDSSDATLILIDYANYLLNGNSQFNDYAVDVYNGNSIIYSGIMGDVNDDGKVDSSDASYILIIYAESLLN